MNPFRAKRIANHFSESTIIHAKNILYGVTINYMGIQAHFEDENHLWIFLASIAQDCQQEELVTEAVEILAPERYVTA